MEIVIRFIVTVLELCVFVIAVSTFIYTLKESWDEIGKNLWNDLKSNVSYYFYNTRLGMWYKNKQNGVTVLSERQYQRLIKKNNVKQRIVYYE